jgi:CRISPR system Cascade subunit CasE
MFLTRFNLNPRSRSGARYLTNPQRLHAVIYGAMPTQPVVATSEGRPLWRVDRDDAAAPVLWVVSPERPSLDALAEEAGRSVDGLVYQTRPYDVLLDRLSEGQVYAFKLAANASRSGRASPESARTQRFGHVTAAQQLEWLVARAPRHGFSFPPTVGGEPDVVVVGASRSSFRRDQGRVTVRVSEFAGRLRVTDPVALRRALTQGIGHARAYGCGLLTLARSR